MHASLFTIAVAAVAGSAFIDLPPPQITQAPSIKAMLEPRIAFGVGRQIQVVNKRQPSEPKDLTDQSHQWSEEDCQSIYSSIVDNDLPRIPPGSLHSWFERQPVGEINDISEVDAECADIDDPVPPASLSSSYSAWVAEVGTWRQTVHDAVYSTALNCGWNWGPSLDALVARDQADCRIAVSAMFGFTAGSPSSNVTEPTLTSETFDVEVTSTSTPKTDATMSESISQATATTKVEDSSPQSTARPHGLWIPDSCLPRW